MHPLVQVLGNDRTLYLFGIRMVGVSAANGWKLLLTLVFLGVVVLLNRLLKSLLRAMAGERMGRVNFWGRQGIHIVTAVAVITGLVSIWFNNPAQLGSAAAFITAGLAVASQRVITAISGYLIILRGKTFNVGDRIVMGGVRGDVIALGFMQTTIMEMGQPPGEQGDAPAQWVAARQYTGRIVTITNDKIFDNPVYNYTREFPYIWEEMRLPIPYNSDYGRAEQILLEAARRHTIRIAELGEGALRELERRYEVQRNELEPRVFVRLTDNWCEMALRFVVEDHGIRVIKDRMSRQILEGLGGAKIDIASGTYQVVGMPELKVRFTS
jgi:small-conductance mechanosensitive channel